VAQALTNIYFTINVVLNLKASVSVMVGDGAVFFTAFWFSDVNSLKITHIFYREGIDLDQFNFGELKSRA
jgi:hypothetical protein